jgi:AcrR family transcriptional regulator
MRGKNKEINNAKGVRKGEVSGKRKRQYIPADQRRQDILNAAVQVFGEKGFHKTKIQDIAMLAGVAHGTVYRYFSSKSELAIEIIGSRGASGFLESLKPNSYNGQDIEMYMESIIKKYYGNLDERLPLIRFRLAEGVTKIGIGRTYYRLLLHRLLKDLGDFILIYQKKGIIKEGDPFIYGHIFYNIIFGFLYCQELMSGKEITNLNIQELLPQIIEVFLHGVANHQT